MENLILSILIYVAIVAIANCPKKTTATVNPATVPIDYFPEAEETTTETKPVAMPAPKAIAKQPKATLSALIKEEVSKTAIVAPAQPDLNALPIRALYARAKGKVKGYKSMSKARLVVALGGLETATIA